MGSFYNSLVNTIGTIDDLIEKYQEILSKIQSFVVRLFESYENEVSSSIADIFELFSGGIFKSKDYVPFSKNKLITIKNIDDDGFNTTNVSYLSDDKIDTKYLLSIGDLILTMTGNIGRVGVVSEENCYLNQRLLKIKCESKSYAFAYFLKHQQEIITLGKGTAQANLSLEDLRKCYVYNSEEEIKAFAKYDYLFELYVNIQTKINALVSNKQLLLKKYFS